MSRFTYHYDVAETEALIREALAARRLGVPPQSQVTSVQFRVVERTTGMGRNTHLKTVFDGVEVEGIFPASIDPLVRICAWEAIQICPQGGGSHRCILTVGPSHPSNTHQCACGAVWSPA